MSYIGATPLIGNYQKCDAITTSATDTFNLLVGGVAVSPATPQNCIVSLNGVVQAPTSAYTVSGSTIVFDSALTTDDVIDFIVILGNVLDLGTPSDDTVTAAKLNDTVISGQTALGAEPADTDEFLVSDAGVIKRVDYSYIKPSSATWTKIATADYSGAVATVTFTDCFTSTYSIYKIYMHDLHCVTTGNDINVKLLDDGDSAIGNWTATTNKNYTNDAGGSGGAGASIVQGGADNFYMSTDDLNDTAVEVSSCQMTIYTPYESVNTQIEYNLLLNADNGYQYQWHTYANLFSSTSARSLNFYTGGGANFSGYKITVLGLNR